MPKRLAAMAVLASTTYAMTAAGRRAYQAHCAALRALTGAEQPAPSGG